MLEENKNNIKYSDHEFHVLNWIECNNHNSDYNDTVIRGGKMSSNNNKMKTIEIEIGKLGIVVRDDIDVIFG